MTSIGSKAFADCSSLSSVIVKWESPIAITDDAFSNRSNATLYVPQGTKVAYEAADIWKEFKEIEDKVPIIKFADANVKALCIANWDTNGDGELDMGEAAAVTSLGTVFQNNQTITSFDELHWFIGLTAIDNMAFSFCTNLTSITFPNNVTVIGDNAFNGCYQLASITIPKNVTSIGHSAFAYCCLNSVILPESVTAIGIGAFRGGEGNTSSIIVKHGNTVYDSRNNCNAIIETASNTLIAGCETTIIPESVTSIGDYAFDGCSGLTSITIPESVISIGRSAFRGCSRLTSVHITNLAAWCGISFSSGGANPLSCAHHLFLNGGDVKDRLASMRSMAAGA